MYYIANMELINSSWSGKSDVAELQKRAVALRTLAVAYEAQTRTTTRRQSFASISVHVEELTQTLEGHAY
jgi:hypothetical protein